MVPRLCQTWNREFPCTASLWKFIPCLCSFCKTPYIYIVHQHIMLIGYCCCTHITPHGNFNVCRDLIVSIAYRRQSPSLQYIETNISMQDFPFPKSIRNFCALSDGAWLSKTLGWLPQAQESLHNSRMLHSIWILASCAFMW